MVDPPSRAGDRIVLRALMNLMCAVSSCPQDIIPGNGLVPTELLVRVERRRLEMPLLMIEPSPAPVPAETELIVSGGEVGCVRVASGQLLAVTDVEVLSLPACSRSPATIPATSCRHTTRAFSAIRSCCAWECGSSRTDAGRQWFLAAIRWARTIC